MSLNYTTYVQQISNLIVTSTADPNFNTMLPGMIDYAEQRLYRELDLQVSRVSDSTVTLSSGVRTFSLPTDQTIVVTEQLNVWSSAGTTSSNTTRKPLTFVAKEYIDFCWPDGTTGTPLYAAPLNNTTYLLGPAPDQPYTIEVVGTIRPAPLSAANSTTFLSQYLPDLFVAASMVFAAGYMRNYGAQADDPNMPGSWESQYKLLFNSANEEELRKRFQSQGWTPMSVAKTATPPRR